MQLQSKILVVTSKFKQASGAVHSGISTFNEINLGDSTGSGNNRLKFGVGNEFQIYHNSVHSMIENSTGALWIKSTHAGHIYIYSGNSHGIYIEGDDGHVIPSSDSAIDLGLTGTRFRNVYADTLYGDGSNLTSLNGSQIASGTVPVARIGTGTKNTSTFYRGDGTFATVTAPAITAINSPSSNRVVTSDGGTTVTAESALTFDGTSLTVGTNADIRFSSGSWTGNHYGKIQLHNQSLYISGGSTSLYSIIFRVDNQDKIYMKGDGTFYPTTNNVSDLGTSTYRWRNIYTNDLNLSNEGGKNEVDGTWGNYTIQEGESDLFLINKRNGKKYKFNLTEVS